MHEGKFVAIGSISDFMREHGKGYTIEIQISLPIIKASLLPKLDPYRFTGKFVDSEL